MTNEEKRNIYNNIQNLYNMDFKTWQEVLAMLYNLVADVEQRFEAFEQKFELMLGKEVTEAIKKMYEDGTLAEIINKEVFDDLNNKIDEVEADILMTLTDYMGENNKKLEEINERLNNKANYININNSVNLGAFNPSINDLTKDSTEAFQNAINYCKRNGGGIVSIPSGKYLINGTIIIPSEVILKGSGKNFEGGSILWREENTGIKKPFIQLGNIDNNGAVIECGVSDIVIIGDSTVKDVIGIENKGVSVHAIVIKNIEIECFAGIPIKLESAVESSRVQFIEIDNIDIGFDWGVYKPNAITPKTNNNICGGIWLRGYIDGIYIKNCRFTNYIDTSNFVSYLNSNTSYGVRIEKYNDVFPQNNFHIENCFFRGFKACVYSNAMNMTINDCYVEHCKNVVYMDIINPSSITNVFNNYISGCEKLITVEDNRESKALNCFVNVNGNYVKWGIFNKSYLFDIVGTVEKLVFNNGYNALPSTWPYEKFEIATTNAKPFVVGIVNHQQNIIKTSNYNLTTISEGAENKPYILRPNCSKTDDFGLDLIDSENRKVGTFHNKNTQLYTYKDGTTKTVVMRVDDEKAQCEFPTNIILRGSGGKRYQIGVNDSGVLFTSLITT